MQCNKKVMVIDDDEIHLYTVKGLLSSDNVEVVTQLGSFGATFRVKDVKPDLLLLDVNMPALSGANLADLLKPISDGLKMPILFYSSNDEDSLKELVERHKVSGYICKGDIDGLRNKVSEYLAAAA